LPFDFGPPVSVKPPHEFVVAAGAGRPKEALAEFDFAKAAPGRALSLQGRERAVAAMATPTQ
jgi:hypothetical protein